MGLEKPVGEGEENGEKGEPDGKKKEEEKKDEPQYEHSVSVSRLFSFADKIDAILIILGTFGALANGIAQPASFIIFGKLIDKFIVFTSQSFNKTMVPITINLETEMKTFAIYYVIIAAGMLVAGFFQAGCWSLTAIRQVNCIRRKFYRSILKQDIGWFDVNESGGLLSRLTDDLLKIQAGLGDKIGLIIFSVSLCLGGFVVGFFYSWKLTLVILATVPVLAIVGALFGKVMSDLSSDEQTAYASAAAVATEVISSIRTVAAFCGEYEEIERYNSQLAIAEKAGVKKAMALGGSMGLTYFVMFGSYGLGFWYGSQLVAEKEIHGGEMLIVFFSVMFGGFQIGSVAPNIQAFATARGAAHYVYDVCDKEPVINSMSDDGESLDNVSGDITVENVDFTYPSRTEVQILKNFNLEIKNGSTVALVGESGCGKSTIVKLVQRFYDPQSGDVKLDGVSLKDLNLKWLRTNIGVVGQEPVLFELSIAENIQLGESSHVTQEDIENAAKKANAHDFIMSLPQQYNTYVGEGGAQMSGGQKQRIAIARALVRDPKILLLDEATSALDTESEGIVQAALDKASEGRTTIIIAHRLSTIINADKIIAVRNGEVVETGTHTELMAKKGFYYQLVILQTVVEEDDDDDDAADVDGDLGDEEKAIKMKAKLMRTLSTLSGGSDEDDEIVKKLTQQLSTGKSRQSLRRRKSSVKVNTKKKDEEEEEKIEPASYMRILKYSAPEWHLMSIGCFFSALLGAFPLVFAIILSELLAEFAIIDTLKEKSKMYAVYFVLLGVVEGLAFVFASLCFGKAGEMLTRRLRKLTFQSLLRQDIAFFDDPKNTTGQIAARLASDASKVNAATSTQFNTMTQVFVMALSSLIIAFIYSWKLTLTIVAFVPLLFIGGAAQIQIFGDFAAEEGKVLVTANALASQSIMNIRTVASIGKEFYFVDKFNALLEAPFKKSRFKSLVYGFTFGMSASVMMLANAAAFALGGKLVNDGELKMQDMFKVVLAVMFGAMTAGQVISMAPNVIEGKVSAARIFSIMDRVPTIDSFSTEGDSTDPERVRGDVTFSSVDFNYPTRPEVKVLDGLSLTVTAGQKVALVGSSGCGKSTTIGLLERFYDPLAGYITLDHRNTKEYNIRWLRSLLGLVSQEPVLFARSIRDNITYGMKEKPSEKEIETAAKNANIHSFVITLPKGYDTMVGEKGTLISGGQKQRIAIARALIRNPKIMLLDEATSALDSESEKVVQDALDAAMVGRTSIIIAHRLSTIQNADVIVVLQAGKIVEMGTHQELLTKQGVYYQLNKNQVTN